MAIYLVRHGESVSNAARIVQLPDVRLSAAGIEQAELLADRLATAGISHILSSDLPRATMTADAVHRVTRAPVTLDAGLQERNYGDVRGTPYSALCVDIFAADYEPPGGETWAAFHARVDAAWVRVLAAAAQTSGHLAVVTHGLVCQAVLERHVDAPPGAAPVWGNTALTVIDGTPPRHVRLLACTAHLDATPAGGGRV
jgi:broad specificity phosphatase PhoE